MKKVNLSLMLVLPVFLFSVKQDISMKEDLEIIEAQEQSLRDWREDMAKQVNSSITNPQIREELLKIIRTASGPEDFDPQVIELYAHFNTERPVQTTHSKPRASSASTAAPSTVSTQQTNPANATVRRPSRVATDRATFLDRLEQQQARPQSRGPGSNRSTVYQPIAQPQPVPQTATNTLGSVPATRGLTQAFAAVGATDRREVPAPEAMQEYYRRKRSLSRSAGVRASSARPTERPLISAKPQVTVVATGFSGKPGLQEVKKNAKDKPERVTPFQHALLKMSEENRKNFGQLMSQVYAELKKLPEGWKKLEAFSESENANFDRTLVHNALSHMIDSVSTDAFKRAISLLPANDPYTILFSERNNKIIQAEDNLRNKLIEILKSEDSLRNKVYFTCAALIDFKQTIKNFETSPEHTALMSEVKEYVKTFSA